MTVEFERSSVPDEPSDVPTADDEGQEQLPGITEMMNADEKQTALITSLADLYQRIEVVEVALRGAAGAMKYPQDT